MQSVISQHFALQTAASSEAGSSHQERMRKLKETQKRVEEEKRRIAEQVQYMHASSYNRVLVRLPFFLWQIKADRQEASKKEPKASVREAEILKLDNAELEQHGV